MTPSVIAALLLSVRQQLRAWFFFKLFGEVGDLRHQRIPLLTDRFNALLPFITVRGNIVNFGRKRCDLLFCPFLDLAYFLGQFLFFASSSLESVVKLLRILKEFCSLLRNSSCACANSFSTIAFCS